MPTHVAQLFLSNLTLVGDHPLKLSEHRPITDQSLQFQCLQHADMSLQSEIEDLWTQYQNDAETNMEDLTVLAEFGDVIDAT